MVLRCGDYSDIDWKEVFGKTLWALIVYVVLFGLICFIIWAGCTRAETMEFNEYAEAFNVLSEDEREMFAPLVRFRDSLSEEENLFPLRTLRDPVGTLIGRLIWLAIVIALPILSLVTFLAYWYEKDSRYRLANLPLSKIYGWVLLLAMFAAWPILVISGIMMLVARYGWSKREKKAIEEQVQEELDYKQPSVSERIKTMRSARQQYVRYRAKGRMDAWLHEKQEIQEAIDREKKHLQACGKRVQESQKRLSEYKAQMEGMGSGPISEEDTRARAAAEWDIISEMRGVSSIVSRKTQKSGQKSLIIDVAVRVPYKGDLYDFGDYRISIGNADFSCRRIRSGVRLNALSRSPDYNQSSGFCFGGRRSAIDDYVKNGRLLEAITLIIDSLHSVNEGVEVDIPHCFRKISTIERARRKIWRKRSA
ncbi:hypothetical protein FWD07_01265 [Candidatus Saccharibacteria bacterium]|nr:hypothetical protein [Candidatus Saccharibacteria bacterium]